MSWTDKVKPKQYKDYLWGFYFKGNSYHEFRIKFTHYTLFVPIKRSKTEKRTKFFKEMRRH